MIPDRLIGVDAVLEAIRAAKHPPLRERIEWDLRQTTVNEFKGRLSEPSKRTRLYRRQILLESMPRCVGLATAWHQGERVLDLLFDAADIEQGRLFPRAIECDPLLSGALREAASSKKLSDVLGANLRARRIARAVFAWSSQHPTPDFKAGGT